MRTLLAVAIVVVGLWAVGCDSSPPPPIVEPVSQDDAVSRDEPVSRPAAESTPADPAPPQQDAVPSATARPAEAARDDDQPARGDDRAVLGKDRAALGAELGKIVLAAIREEFGGGALQLEVVAFPLDRRADGGPLWAVITNGPQPAYVNDDGEGVNFFHFMAVYRRDGDGAWSGPLAELTIESAPQRTSVLDVFELPTLAAPAGAILIAIRGSTGAHSGTLDVLRFESGRLETMLSHVSARPDAGEVVDLDGDGTPEVVLNDSNPFVFCYACAVEERREQVYRWVDGGYRLVPLEAPAGLPAELAEAAGRVVRLARADLWREAAALAATTARRGGGRADLRWLSILVNRTAALRLAHAGTPGQPLLTNVLAGEYERAFALISMHTPAEAFSLDGPLLAGTAAASDLTAMAVTLIGYSERALEERPSDAAIHAVRALGLALASPDDLGRAREALGQAVEFAAGDSFLLAAQAFLRSVERAPGTAAGPPAAEGLIDGPEAAFFEAGGTLGTGDRGRLVRALQQRLARAQALGFEDPGRYYDVYDEATREAVLVLQVRVGLPPDGVVDGVTWQALERVLEQQEIEPVEAAATPPPSAPPAEHGDAGEAVVYLTFDDGPHPTWTPQVLDTLARHGAVATFFVLGQSVVAYPELAARIVREGHEAENHTFDHASLAKIDRAAFVAEVEDTDRALHAAVGEAVDPIACLRPPYGAIDADTRALAAELGKEIVLWNVDPQDWRRPGAAQIAQHLLAHVRPGGILLMHDGGGERSQTVAALDVVLRELTLRGYRYGLLCR